MIELGKMLIRKMEPAFKNGWVVNVKNGGVKSSPGITSEMLFEKNKGMASSLKNIFSADMILAGLNPNSPYRIKKLLNLEHKYQTDDKAKATHFIYFELKIEARDRSKTKILDALISDILNNFINVNKLGKGQEVSISANFEPNYVNVVEIAIVFEGAHESQ